MQSLETGHRCCVCVCTGMQSLETVRRVYELVLRHTSQLALLQCTSAYPAPDEHVQLAVLHQYQQLFPRAVVGYSGHELGTAITVAAVALGAKVSRPRTRLPVSWQQRAQPNRTYWQHSAELF